MTQLLEMLQYPFLVRALAVGLMVSLCAALLGVSMVLKRYSMIGDGLSHVAFGAMAVATAVGWAPLALAIPVVMASAFLLLRISANSKIRGDAAIAMLSAACLAVGVMVVSQTSGMNTAIYNYMFGSILSLSTADTVISLVLSAAVLLLFVLFYTRIFSVTFDETFSRATGTRAGLFNAVIALLTAVTVVLGMRMMGALLISSLVIFPALTAMRLCKRFFTVVLCAAAVSVICFTVGMTLSYGLGAPSGASVVLTNVAAFLAFSLARLIRGGVRR